MNKIIYGVIWIDNMIGPLTLQKPCAESAINSAQDMVKRGTDKIRSVRAVQVTEDDKLITLWENENANT